MIIRRPNRQRHNASAQVQSSRASHPTHAHAAEPSQPTVPTLLKWLSESISRPRRDIPLTAINQTLAEHFSELQELNDTIRGQLKKNKEEIKEIRDVAQCWTETFPAAQPSDSIGTPSHKSQE